MLNFAISFVFPQKLVRCVAIVSTFSVLKSSQNNTIYEIILVSRKHYEHKNVYAVAFTPNIISSKKLVTSGRLERSVLLAVYVCILCVSGF